MDGFVITKLKKKTLLEKINSTFAENKKRVALLVWWKGNTQHPGNLGFGVSRKKAKPCLGH